jgi:beta-phosphoglucomutase
MANIDAVLFDFDGVLIDSEPLHFACWRDVAARLDLRVDPDWCARYAVGVSDREMVRMVCEVNGRLDQLDSLGRLLLEKKRLFSQRVVQEVPMPASVRDLLLTLPLPIAVVSTSFRIEIEPVLIANGVRDRLAALVCGDDVQNFKPHPEPYLIAAARLNAFNPLVVEDSDTGAAAGAAAGCTVVRIGSAHDTAASVRHALGTG